MDIGPTIEATGNPQRLLIVDGHAYAYRAFFAIRSLSSPSGQPTNAIYGFIRMLAKARERVQPSHIIVVWDDGLAAERMALLPEYKAQRAAMPSDLEQQLDQIVEYLKAANIFSFLKKSCEADDCIAAITRQATGAGMEVVIASSDKDFMQLISPQVKMLNPHEKSEMLFDTECVRRKTGVEPTQIVDWLSLIGDSVDNINGISGIGPKTAANLLRQFGSIEELYRRLPEVESDRLRTALETSPGLLRRNQQLVKLKDETQCETTLEVLTIKPENYDALRPLYVGWGFKGLTTELDRARIKAGEIFSSPAEKELKSAELFPVDEQR